MPTAEELAKAKEESRAFWSQMAASWERHADRIRTTSLPVHEWLLSRLAAKQGEEILELAAGRGEAGFEAARAIGPTGRLLTTDLSEEMLAFAGRHAEELGLANVEFRTLDAEEMDLPGASFDAIICRYAFMLMQRQERAFAECGRVLRPGGRLVFAVWTTAEENPWITGLRDVLDRFVEMPRPDPNAPGGMNSMAHPERIRALAREGGMEVREMEKVPVTTDFGSGPEMWDHYVDFLPWLGQALGGLSEEQRAAVREGVIESAERFRSGGGISIPGRTWCVLCAPA